MPRKTVGEVRKLIDGVGGEVEVSVSPTRIQFAFERAVLVSRLIDGTFPDYERVIPTGNEKMAIFRAEELRPRRSTASPRSRPRRPGR